MKRLLGSAGQVFGRQTPLRRALLMAAVPISGAGAVWGYSRYLTAQEDARMKTTEELLQEKLGKIKLSSNVHTAKWRVYTDKGKDLFAQGRFEEAERYLIQAMEEAKMGFGEEDFHVASCCNNLAELYRTQKDYARALPLYLRGVELLQQELGPEHPSVGFALHNIAGFYLLQSDFETATSYYERALKIKGRGLGLNHPEYANTMFHLGKVKQLTGQLKDAEDLIRQAVEILEDDGFGDSQVAIRKMCTLLEVLVQSNQLKEAENLARRVLHTVELSEGPEGRSTSQAMENLANVLHLRGNLDEAEELYKRSLEIKHKAHRGDDIQVWPPLFKLAFICMDRAERLVADNARPLAEAEYNKAEALIRQAVSIAEKNWNAVNATSNPVQVIVPYLAQSLNALGLVVIKRLEHGMGSQIHDEAEGALRRCLNLFNSEVDAPALKEKNDCTNNLAKLSSMTNKQTS